MRTKNSLKNTSISMLANILTIIVGLISQAVFIKTLGEEYLGLNGLFTNIISMLSVVELGISSAIIYNLYKPISENNIKKIKALMYFYRKCYLIISIIIFILGLAITPFLEIFTGNITIDINIKLVYLLFVIDIVASYFLSYKRSIIIANQKNYIITIIHIIYLVILNTFQIAILLISKNYYLYLIIKIIMRVAENIIITIKANQLYPYLKNNQEQLDDTTKKDIITKVKALFFHKLGGFFVLGTDNIIISKFLGVITVGLYSNYYLIINSIKTIFTQVMNTLTPSIGNLLLEENKEKNYQVFKRLCFINFWITLVSGISLLIVMDSFITIWIGKKYLFSINVLFILVFDYYQKSMRNSYMAFKEAAGIYHEDRFVPLIESFINIVTSIILLHYFKLAGVFMGTIISSLVLWGYSYPKYVYKKLFGRSYLAYFKETTFYLVLFTITLYISYNLKNLINIENIYLSLFNNVMISILVPNIIMLLLFYKSDNFKYYINMLKSIRKRG